MANRIKKIGALGGVASMSVTAKGTPTAFTPPPDDHPIYHLVGRVAAEWARLEHSLDRIIWGLASLNPASGACITAQIMGASPRYITIESQLTHESQGNDVLKPFIKKIRSLSGMKHLRLSNARNRIVHDPWYVRTSDGQTAQRRSMPKDDRIYGLLDRDKNDIEDTIREIIAQTERIEDFRRDLARALRRQI
jgi:hypothetical protein